MINLSHKIFIKYLAPHDKTFYWTVLFSLIIAGLEFLIPAIYGWMLDSALNSALTKEIDAQFIPLLVSAAILSLANNKIARSVDNNRFSLSIECEMDYFMGLISHIFEIPLDFFERKNSGEIAEKICTGGRDLGNVIGWVILSTLPEILTIIIILAFILWLDYQIEICFLLIIIAFVLLATRNRKEIADTGEKIFAEYESIKERLTDDILNIESIKANATEKEEINAFKIIYKKIIEKSVSFFNIWTGIQMNQKNFIDIAKLVILAVCLIQIISGKLTAGNTLTILMYVGLIASPLSMLSNNYVTTRRSLASIRAGEKLYDEEKEKSGTKTLTKPINIDLKNVSVSYGKRARTFEDLNITIKSRQVIGIVGPSGIGKSTLIKIISGLKRVNKDEGTVLFNGTDITEINSKEIRESIASTPQVPILFKRSIMDNIRNWTNATDEEVIEVAKEVGAHDFIKELPNQYQEIVGVEGKTLSVGQRQKILIARAILKFMQDKTEFLALDEATASMDYESAEKIHKVINKLKKEKNKTIIIITHKLDAVQDADNIYVINGGKSTENGNHKELIEKRGYYQKIYNRQKKF